MGVASGSGWNLWVWLLGVVVRRYIDFLILLIPSCICSFLQQHPIPTFCSFFKMFFVLVPVLFLITFYVLNNFFAQYKHTYGNYGLPMAPYEGCTYSFIHEQAHTNVRFLSWDGHQLYERGVDLEVEGVRYRCIAGRPLTYWARLLQGAEISISAVNACHVDYVYKPRDSHVRGTE